jgi:hypothetical protein
MRNLFLHSIAMLRSKRLVGLHLVANAVLLAGASLWLLIPDEHGWQLLASAVSALLMLFLFLWLNSGTLAYGADLEQGNLRAAFRLRLRGLLWLLAGLAALFLCMYWVNHWTEWQDRLAIYLYSKTPSSLRPRTGYFSYYRGIGWGVRLVFWYLLPTLMLPWTAAKTIGGKFLAGLRTLLRWQYWQAMAIAVLFGVFASELLLGWTPGHTLREQSASLAIRLVIAYLLVVAAWLMTCGILGYFVGPKQARAATAAD